MSLYHVFYDPERAEEFESEVKPLLPDGCQCTAYDSARTPSLQEGLKVLVWLRDEPLYTFLPDAVENKWAVGFLPHPGLKRFYRTFPVPQKLDDALQDIDSTVEPVMFDLMFCNQQLVLGSVMLGEPSTMKPAASIENSIWSKLKHITQLTLNLSKTHLFPYKLETQKGFVLNTAAFGITAVYRPSGSEFTKRVVPETVEDESSLNAIILAPRSISETVRFLFKSLFPSKQKVKGAADYIGHIKTRCLTITANSEMAFSVDGNHYTADKVEIEVKANQLKVISQSLPPKHSEDEPKESVRVACLPKGDAVKELISRPLPWIHHVDQEEIKEIFISLKENAQTSEAYIVLMVLSTLLATVGLFANSAPVIIGAMILAPLMSPIISLSMGVLRQNQELIFTSARTLLTGVVVALAFGTLLTILMPLHTINSEIGARLSPTILDMAVAIISGIAGAYASARSDVAKSLAGVAIAVALVPPLAVAGIGIGWLDWSVFWGAFLLFITNLFGIVLAASITFLVMGFSPFKLAKRGMFYSLLVVGIISIPLVSAFNTMVKEQRVVYALDGWKKSGVEVRVIEIKNTEPMYVSVKLVSKTPLQSPDIDLLKQGMEQLLQQKIQLEATTAVIR